MTIVFQNKTIENIVQKTVANKGKKHLKSSIKTIAEVFADVLTEMYKKQLKHNYKPTPKQQTQRQLFA